MKRGLIVLLFVIVLSVGVVSLECDSNVDCPPNDFCIAGYCELIGMCSSDSHCNKGKICVDAKCVKEGDPLICGNTISTSGEYFLHNDNGKINQEGDFCIKIESSEDVLDVILDCQGATFSCPTYVEGTNDNGEEILFGGGFTGCEGKTAIIVEGDKDQDWKNHIVGVTIRNCKFAEGYGHAITVDKVKSVKIENNNFLGTSDSVLELTTFDNAKIFNNTFDFSKLSKAPENIILANNFNSYNFLDAVLNPSIELENNYIEYKIFPLRCYHTTSSGLDSFNLSLKNNNFFSASSGYTDPSEINFGTCNVVTEPKFFLPETGSIIPLVDLITSEEYALYKDLSISPESFLDLFHNSNADGGGSVKILPLDDCEQDKIILRLSDSNAALGTYWDYGVGDAEYALCYMKKLSFLDSFIFDPHECGEEGSLVELQGPVAKPAQKLFPGSNFEKFNSPVCYSELNSCVISESNKPCPGDRGCVLELSNSTNAFISACGYGYNYKVCCEGQNYDVVDGEVEISYCTKDSECGMGEFCAMMVYNGEVGTGCLPFSGEGKFCSETDTALLKCEEGLLCVENVCFKPYSEDYDILNGLEGSEYFGSINEGFTCSQLPDEFEEIELSMTCDAGERCYEGDPNLGTSIEKDFSSDSIEPNCCAGINPYCVGVSLNTYGESCFISKSDCDDPDRDGLGTQIVTNSCEPLGMETQSCTIYKGDNGLPFFGYLAGVLTLVILVGFYLFRNRKV